MDHKPPIIAPSILAADYSRLGNQINSCIDAGVEWIHCDIMDGHFVPNISFGPPIVEAAARAGDVFLDVHLMIEHPDRYVDAFVEAGAGMLTVHQEVCPHLHRTVEHIKNHDIKAGVAINPATPLTQIIPILPYVDLVLIMSVNPGFGGQTFIEATYHKLQQARSLRDKHDAHFLIEVDGGVKPGNIQDISRAGADVLVAGSSIFKSGDIAASIQELSREAARGRDLFV